MKRLIVLLLLVSVPSWGAAPPVRSCDSGGLSSQSDGSCPLSPNTTLGDLIVCVGYYQSITVTVTGHDDGGSAQTWHDIAPVRGSNNSTIISWTVATGSTWSTTGQQLSESINGDFFCAEYTGMAVAASVFDCSVGASGNSTALNSGNCTPTASNDLIFGAGGVMQNSATFTPGAGFTIEQSESHSSIGDSAALIDLNSTTCNAQNASMASTISGQWSMAMAAFKTSAPGACSSAVSLPTGVSIQGAKASFQGSQLTIK